MSGKWARLGEPDPDMEPSLSLAPVSASTSASAHRPQPQPQPQPWRDDSYSSESEAEDILEPDTPRTDNQVIVALAAAADDEDVEQAAIGKGKGKGNGKGKRKAKAPAPYGAHVESDGDGDGDDMAQSDDGVYGADEDVEMGARPGRTRDRDPDLDLESASRSREEPPVDQHTPRGDHDADPNPNPDPHLEPSSQASHPHPHVIQTRASSAIKLAHPANVRVRTLFGAVWLKPRRKCMWEINDEVRFTVWLLALLTAIIAAGFFIASIATNQITFYEVLEIHKHAVGVIVGGVFAFLAIVMSAVQIRQHQQNWTHPPSQRCVVRILFMVPVYAGSAWLSLVFIKSSLYIDFIRLCYEAFVLYTFLILLTKYLGGHEGVVESMRTKPPMDWPTPFCICDPVQPSSKFLYWIKYCTLQYTIVTPILSLLAIVLSLFHAYGDGEVNFEKGYIYVALIQNFSQLVSLYCLVWLYVVLKNELRPFKPMYKFLVVKSVVFFTFWQSVLLAVLVNYNYIQDYQDYSAGEIQIGLQDLCICIEMFIAAAVHKYTFGYETYANGEMKLLMDQRAFYLAQQSYQRAVQQQQRAAEQRKQRELAHQLQIAVDHRRLGGREGTVLMDAGMDMDEPLVLSPSNGQPSPSSAAAASAGRRRDSGSMLGSAHDADIEKGLMELDRHAPIEIDEEQIARENAMRVEACRAKLADLRVEVSAAVEARARGGHAIHRAQPRTSTSQAAYEDEGSALVDEAPTLRGPGEGPGPGPEPYHVHATHTRNGPTGDIDIDIEIPLNRRTSSSGPATPVHVVQLYGSGSGTDPIWSSSSPTNPNRTPNTRVPKSAPPPRSASRAR